MKSISLMEVSFVAEKMRETLSLSLEHENAFNGIGGDIDREPAGKMKLRGWRT